MLWMNSKWGYKNADIVVDKVYKTYPDAKSRLKKLLKSERGLMPLEVYCRFRLLTWKRVRG